MVPGKIRNFWIPSLGIIGLILMFLKLPEVQQQLDVFQCELCLSNETPYIPLVAAAYYSLLLSAALLLPSFPGIHLARGGLIGVILLAFGLTYLQLPKICVLCLLGHLCNIAIWGLWVVAPRCQKNNPLTHLKERLCLMLFGTFTVVALFSCLNLTLLVYGLKKSQTYLASGLSVGDSIPSFIATTNNGEKITNEEISNSTRTFINFVSPNCPYCKEQLDFLNRLEEFHERIIAVSSVLELDLMNQLPAAEWVEDTNGILRERFKVEGYPILFLIGNKGTIEKIVPGVPDSIKDLIE